MGTETRFQDAEQLNSKLAHIKDSPTEAGTVEMIVRRPAVNERQEAVLRQLRLATIADGDFRRALHGDATVVGGERMRGQFFHRATGFDGGGGQSQPCFVAGNLEFHGGGATIGQRLTDSIVQMRVADGFIDEAAFNAFCRQIQHAADRVIGKLNGLFLVDGDDAFGHRLQYGVEPL